MRKTEASGKELVFQNISIKGKNHVIRWENSDQQKHVNNYFKCAKILKHFGKTKTILLSLLQNSAPISE